RAVYWNLKSNEMNQGASTITQQLARNAFELKERSLSRKIVEAFLSRRIESEVGSKEKVLEFYVNRIYFGGGYYGIAAAAEGYFGKEAKNLTLAEAATLAGVIRNPYYRSPRKFPEASKTTRDGVLKRMREEGLITESAMRRAQKSPMRVAPRQNLTGKSGYVYERVRQEAINLLGAEGSKELSQGGFVIRTTIDGNLQTIAEEALKQGLEEIESNEGYKGQTYAQYKEIKDAFRKANDPEAKLMPPKYLQGAVMVINNETGAVLAQVGGREFNDSMFDRTLNAEFRPGTAFTPFVYASAFQNQPDFFPGTLISDSPLSNRLVMIGGTNGILGEWGTENRENKYEGMISARQALAQGKNGSTIRVGMETGISKVVKTAESLGLEFEGDLKKFNATMLGRNPVNITDMCLAYSTFPNGGQRTKKTFIIQSIHDSKGNAIMAATPSRLEDTEIDQYTAHHINSILSDTFTTGNGKVAKEKYGLGDFPAAGKSGTEYGYTDNWFIGYTSEVTCAVWTGFDRRQMIYPEALSTETSLPIWTKVINATTKFAPPKGFDAPKDAKRIEICKASGERACDECFEYKKNASGINTQVRSTYYEYLRPTANVRSICHVHGQGTGFRDLARVESGPLRANPLITADAIPVSPKSPTVAGDDPYHSHKPKVIKAQVIAPAAEPPITPGGDATTTVPPVARPLDVTTTNPAAPTEGAGGPNSMVPVARPLLAIPVARPLVEAPATEEIPKPQAPSRVQLARPQPIDFE
ncbi:MAG: transglycosylase domain-containing protein, partial [Verrucomicrobiota bacterium]